MYTLNNKIKIIALVCILLGVLGIGYSFLKTPQTVEQVKELVNSMQHHNNVSADIDHHNQGHYEHLLHQLQNKPWAAIYIAGLFFLLISLGTLAFYAINRAAQVGWSPVLFRIMEGITAYLIPGGIIFYILLILSGLHWNHLFIWMDKEIVATDHLLQGKQGFLNTPFFLIRSAIYLLGWIAYRTISRRLSLKQDSATDNKPFIRNFQWSAGFLVFFLVSESMMSWDWIMSFDPHWFSTLFGWYVFASFIGCAIATIILITLYLKKQGYLEFVNNSHLHDLAKFLFGFSVFWTYLWFSQYLLIWYSNIPEEITYYITRIQDYKIPFFLMVILNFALPLLILIDSDIKRRAGIVSTVAVIVLLGHYLDFFNMIMPATVGNQWSIGIAEISALLFFFGIFLFAVFSSIAKAPLLAKRDPFIEESKHFHY